MRIKVNLQIFIFLLIFYLTKQLEIYAKACSKILNMPVKELIIYSFALGKEIIIK